MSSGLRPVGARHAHKFIIMSADLDCCRLPLMCANSPLDSTQPRCAAVPLPAAPWYCNVCMYVCTADSLYGLDQLFPLLLRESPYVTTNPDEAGRCCTAVDLPTDQRNNNSDNNLDSSDSDRV